MDEIVTSGVGSPLDVNCVALNSTIVLAVLLATQRSPAVSKPSPSGYSRTVPLDVIVTAGLGSPLDVNCVALNSTIVLLLLLATQRSPEASTARFAGPVRLAGVLPFDEILTAAVGWLLAFNCVGVYSLRVEPNQLATQRSPAPVNTNPTGSVHVMVTAADCVPPAASCVGIYSEIVPASVLAVQRSPLASNAN